MNSTELFRKVVPGYRDSDIVGYVKSNMMILEFAGTGIVDDVFIEIAEYRMTEFVENYKDILKEAYKEDGYSYLMERFIRTY